MDEGSVDARRWATSLSAEARSFSPGFADCLLDLPDWLLRSPEDAVKAIPLRLGVPDRVYHWSGITPFVVSSVLWSLYAFLRTPDDFWETMRTAIAVGGDVDTTAAMAG